MTLTELLKLDENELGRRFAGKNARQMAAKSVKSRLLPILKHLESAGPSARRSVHDLAKASGCTEKQALGMLERIVCLSPETFHSTSEFLPPVPAMMHLLENELGPITASNLSLANQACKGIVNQAIRPRFARFLRSSFDLGAAQKIELSVEQMVDFLLDEYTEFSKSQDNGLISRAGAYNEGILTRALINAGVRQKDEFDVTGKESNGDMVFYCNFTTPREQLYVEIKSYGARERLLRGLQDLKEPKVGVGFFINPAEFNPKRTQTLIDTNALAIYLPQLVFEKLTPEATSRKNKSGTPFYRPLEDFVEDMREFIAAGEKAYRI